jgi:hypothetical protein
MQVAFKGKVRAISRRKVIYSSSIWPMPRSPAGASSSPDVLKGMKPSL